MAEGETTTNTLGDQSRRVNIYTGIRVNNQSPIAGSRMDEFLRRNPETNSKPNMMRTELLTHSNNPVKTLPFPEVREKNESMVVGMKMPPNAIEVDKGQTILIENNSNLIELIRNHVYEITSEIKDLIPRYLVAFKLKTSDTSHFSNEEIQKINSLSPLPEHDRLFSALLTKFPTYSWANFTFQQFTNQSTIVSLFNETLTKLYISPLVELLNKNELTDVSKTLLHRLNKDVIEIIKRHQNNIDRLINSGLIKPLEVLDYNVIAKGSTSRIFSVDFRQTDGKVKSETFKYVSTGSLKDKSVIPTTPREIVDFEVNMLRQLLGAVEIKGENINLNLQNHFPEILGYPVHNGTYSLISVENLSAGVKLTEFDYKRDISTLEDVLRQKVKISELMYENGFLNPDGGTDYMVITDSDTQRKRIIAIDSGYWIRLHKIQGIYAMQSIHPDLILELKGNESIMNPILYFNPYFTELQEEDPKGYRKLANRINNQNSEPLTEEETMVVSEINKKLFDISKAVETYNEIFSFFNYDLGLEIIKSFSKFDLTGNEGKYNGYIAYCMLAKFGKEEFDFSNVITQEKFTNTVKQKFDFSDHQLEGLYKSMVNIFNKFYQYALFDSNGNPEEYNIPTLREYFVEEILPLITPKIPAEA